MDECGPKSVFCAQGYGEKLAEQAVCQAVDYTEGCINYRWTLFDCDPTPPETPEVGWRLVGTFEQAWYCMNSECTGS